MKAEQSERKHWQGSFPDKHFGRCTSHRPFRIASASFYVDPVVGVDGSLESRYWERCRKKRHEKPDQDGDTDCRRGRTTA